MFSRAGVGEECWYDRLPCWSIFRRRRRRRLIAENCHVKIAITREIASHPSALHTLVDTLSLSFVLLPPASPRACR